MNACMCLLKHSILCQVTKAIANKCLLKFNINGFNKVYLYNSLVKKLNINKL